MLLRFSFIVNMFKNIYSMESGNFVLFLILGHLNHSSVISNWHDDVELIACGVKAKLIMYNLERWHSSYIGSRMIHAIQFYTFSHKK